MKDEPQKKLSRKEVKDQLEALVELFQKVPKLKPKQLTDNVNVKHTTKNKDSLQETISYLRVCIKYSLLDIESLGREVDYLKKLLAENDIS